MGRQAKGSVGAHAVLQTKLLSYEGSQLNRDFNYLSRVCCTSYTAVCPPVREVIYEL